jgi:hypothetical protein
METVPAASQCCQNTSNNEGLNTYLQFSNPIFYPNLGYVNITEFYVILLILKRGHREPFCYETGPSIKSYIMRGRLRVPIIL